MVDRKESREGAEQALDLGEEVLGASRSKTDIGVLVDAPGFDDSSLGELVNDEIDELDLTATVAPVIEELSERRPARFRSFRSLR